MLMQVYMHALQSFNQDNTCIAVADYKGIKIFSLQTHRVCYQADIGSIRCVFEAGGTAGSKRCLAFERRTLAKASCPI